MECFGRTVCLLGLFMPQTSLANILLCAMPAEHLYPRIVFFFINDNFSIFLI